MLLKQDGSEEELSLDMTPSKKMTQETLGGQITFMGQWEDMEVILVINKAAQEEASAAKRNLHKLQPPFHDADVYGDILLMRSDADGNPKGLPLADYEAFKKRDIKEWKPVELEEGGAEDEDDEEGEDDEEDEEDDDEDDEDDDEGEDEDEEDTEIEKMYLDVLKKKVITQYQAVHGKDPTDEEADDLARRLLSAISAAPAPEDGNEDEEEEEEEEEAPANVFGFGAPTAQA